MAIALRLHYQERTKYTPDKRGIEILSSRKTIGWAVGDKKHVSSLLWQAYAENFRGQFGRVVKAPSLHCRERTKYAPDKRGIEILSLKKVIGWAVGDKVTSRRYYGRRKPIFLGSRMAEWLRPQVIIAKNRPNIRRICVGSKSCPQERP